MIRKTVRHTWQIDSVVEVHYTERDSTVVISQPINTAGYGYGLQLTDEQIIDLRAALSGAQSVMIRSGLYR